MLLFFVLQKERSKGCLPSCLSLRFIPATAKIPKTRNKHWHIASPHPFSLYKWNFLHFRALTPFRDSHDFRAPIRFPYFMNGIKSPSKLSGSPLPLHNYLNTQATLVILPPKYCSADSFFRSLKHFLWKSLRLI